MDCGLGSPSGLLRVPLLRLEEIKVQLFLSTRVEGEATDLAFDFSVFGLVPIILRVGGSVLDDMISCFEFPCEFSEMISQGWNGFAGSMREDDEIRVEIQHLAGDEMASTFLLLPL